MAESEECPIKILDHTRVFPTPSYNSVPCSSLTLTLFDIPWLFLFNNIDQPQRLLFYEFPHSSNSLHDDNVLISSLKTSLSLALQKFYPYAAKIMLPPFPDKPRILYTDGEDSVPFTVAESPADFHELAGNHVKDVKVLHPLVPKLSPCSLSSEEDHGTCTIFPDLLAIQVTLFPNSGLCIGIQYNHAVGDGKSINYFLKSWASIYRTGEIETSLIPFLHRDHHVIEDPSGLQTIQLLKEWSEAFPTGGPPSRQSLPALRSNETVRATFILGKANIKRLKDWILNRLHELGQDPTTKISSFTAACAYTWVCLVKSKEQLVQLSSGEDNNNNNAQLCHFGFLADCRNRLKPSIPETYFGNCLLPCIVSVEKHLLLDDQQRDGIVFAARAIDVEVKQILENINGIGPMAAFGKWLKYMKEVFMLGNIVSVAGSPRLNVYNTNFGWGRLRKSEMVQIDSTGAISITESRDEEGGLEIGVALHKTAMHVFTTLFEELESFV